VWARVSFAAHRPALAQVAAKFEAELGWREFCAHLLYHFPTIATENWRREFDRFAWRRSPGDLEAWQRGRTGYPMVDAGMRELWHTGWMHNRMRMIVASFLVKHLRIDWREGEAWFWDTLVDADYGSNSVNWQWVAGTGVDSNMFVRIMAPLVQSEKFDAAGYIRAWVPELAALGDEAIHDPDSAGCRPQSYPAKIIGHREARERGRRQHVLADHGAAQPVGEVRRGGLYPGVGARVGGAG